MCGMFLIATVVPTVKLAVGVKVGVGVEVEVAVGVGVDVGVAEGMGVGVGVLPEALATVIPMVDSATVPLLLL
jgi:hypothetical protein